MATEPASQNRFKIESDLACGAGSERNRFYSIKKDVDELCAQISGKKAIIIEDLHTGECVAMNQDEVFPAASLIKLPILLKMFQLTESKQLDQQERVELAENHRVGGFGVLKNLNNGLNPTVRDLAVLMITLSDNIATNLLIDRIGMGEINCGIQVLGMKDTTLLRKMMDIKAKERGLENRISAKDVQTLLKAILNHCFRAEIMDILIRQQCNNKLPALMEEEIKIAHKTGDLPGIEHDAGIIYYREKEILAVVLTKELTNNQEGIWLNQQIGKLIYTKLLK